MIVIGSLAPDTALDSLIEEIAGAEASVAAAARLARDREWIIDLSPAVFATYSQAVVNAANIITRSGEMIAANPAHASILLAEVRRVVEKESKSLAALHARIEKYAAKAPYAKELADVSARFVSTWQQMADNIGHITAADGASIKSARDRWKALSSRIEELQLRGRP